MAVSERQQTDRSQGLLCAFVWVGVLVLPSGGRVEGQQPKAAWAISPTPIITLGRGEVDSNDVFTAVVGATRLPDGRILVGDRDDFSLHLFSAEGAHLRAFGRKGTGPGEIGYLLGMLRCGDSVFTLDNQGNRVSVFSLDGTYTRSFRFGTPQATPLPYRTVCNRDRLFAHFGWETARDMKRGPYRPSVPFWLTGPDSAVRTVIGNFPGSDRFGQAYGTRPLALGKQPDIAVATDRVYIGTAERYEIMVFDRSGRRIGTIQKRDVDLRTTKDDIAFAKAHELAIRGERWRATIEQDYATMPFPETVPAYATLRVDSEGYLWVQDYPRARSQTVRWLVFTAEGAQVAEVQLPTDLEVYEIGRDYVLGRFLAPAESIPQVRLYRLRRS